MKNKYPHDKMSRTEYVGIAIITQSDAVFLLFCKQRMTEYEKWTMTVLVKNRLVKYHLN